MPIHWFRVTFLLEVFLTQVLKYKLTPQATQSQFQDIFLQSIVYFLSYSHLAFEFKNRQSCSLDASLQSEETQTVHRESAEA